MKKIFHNKNSKSLVSIAKIFFFSGIFFLATSIIINFVFIRPSNFKQQYQQKQYDECLKKNKDKAKCQTKFN